MATEPVQVLDGIVRGIVFAGYDFVRLAVAGAVTPFVAKSRRFWRAVLKANKRLSSLTYLVLWIVLTLSIGLGTSHQLVSGVVGLSKTPDVTLPAAIVISLAIVLLVDVLLRATLFPVRNRIKREMYASLARIGVGNILLGACTMMLIVGPSWLLPPGFSMFDSFAVRNIFDSDPESTIHLPYPNPFLFLFSFSLAVIILKAFSIKGRIRRIAVGFSVVFAAPVLLLYASVLAIAVAYRGDISLLPKSDPSSAPTLKQRYTECKFGSNQINVVTFLKLSNANSLPIKICDFAIRYEATTGVTYLGKVVSGSADFILLNADYTRVELVATYERKPAEPLPTEAIPCSLQFVMNPLSDSDERVDVPDPSE